MTDAPGERALPERGERRPTRADAVVLVLVLVASGAGSLWLGQDLNFDLLSYHHYNGYAFVSGRLDRDIAAADWHTYLNPLLDALGYLGMVAMPPRLFGFLLGAVHGLNVALVYLLSLVVLSDLRHARLLAGLVSLVTALGPNAVSLLGTTMGNNVVSIPTLVALLALAWRSSDRPSEAAGGWGSGTLLLAGAACGAAAGLRLTAAVDLVAVGVAVLALGASRRALRALARTLAALGIGALLAFGATNGVWALRLWERFGNPLFPLANQLFRSPYFEPVYSRDYRFVARDAWDYLRPALDIALGRMERFQEIGGRDGRYLLLALALVAFAALAFARRRSWSALVSRRASASLVLAYWLAGYVVWVTMFYYYRYLTTLELLAPLALVVVLRALVPARVLVPAALVACLCLVAWSRPGSWGRGAWQDDWFGLELPALARRPDALVLLAGGPVSYAIPDFPASDRFAHLTAIRERGGSALFDQRVAEAIETHRGPLLLLSTFRVDARAQDPATRRPRWVYNAEEDAGPVARRFGLRLTNRCEDTRTRRGPLYVCEVEKEVRP